ncbi:unnamed protein product [Cuscuta campestris]|uniref:non-specific serine/threonine protein kinase n=1 Tax=Cuscuta campestris TaxID=132261 RepID=A0A484K5C5_9ASTE|nr:unnamed protein product [Cuscuta campestris]
MSLFNWVILICLFCSSLGLQTPNQSCHPSDLHALRQFAGNLTKGSILSTWSGAVNCCIWDGVGCEGEGMRVISLSLSGKGLQGAISLSLENLDNLRFLDLSHNHLQGEFPLDLSKLKQLRVLDLSHNSFNGSVLGALNGLQSLHALNLSSNLFTGDFADFGGFQNLVVLNVSNNSFSGALGSRRFCSISKKLRILDFSRNSFEGGLDVLIECGFPLLELNLDSNLLSGQLPDSLYLISSLESLSLSANYFSGQLSANLSKLSNLKSLILSRNHFSGVLPDVFGNFTQLEVLDANSNKFSGLLPYTLALCSTLQVLDLRNNSLFGPIDIDFTRLSNLTALDLASNKFSGPLPRSLSSCKQLQILSLAKNMLRSSIPESYANLSSLVFLTLSNNSFENLSGALLVLQHCQKLSTLILTRNFHGEEIPKNVIGFENLMTFAIGNCHLRGQIPAWLSNCTKLQVLDLSWNQLDGSIPFWIGKMENLFYIDFSNNSLTGEIPRSLTELKSLTSSVSYLFSLNASSGIPLFIKRNQSGNGLQYNQASSFPQAIYLSNNRISGTIPPDIGQLRQLHVLDLSRNNISGTIPGSISNMLNLEVLDLSNNELYGSIPPSLDRLTFLSKFSVANNHLLGAIPTGGQFFSFPSSSFGGNPGLCGKIVYPCAANGGPLQPAPLPSYSNNRLGRSGIIEITISVTIGFVILLSLVLLRLSRRNSSDQIEESEEEVGISSRLSDAFCPSNLVLFKNSYCNDITVADLLRSTNDFSQSNIIGCGGFGLVYKVDLPNGSKVAIKKLSGDSCQLEREFHAEVEALSRAQHENLVALQGYCSYGSDRLLIYSYMENGSLDYWLHERVDGSPSLMWNTRLKIALGAARGLSYLHKEPNIIHRDIKTSNILLDERFDAHLADFGLARLLCPYDTHVTTDLVGTLGYIPPEYSQTLTATFRGDVYSYGVVLLELITGKRPVEVCKGKNCRNLVPLVFQMKSERREEEIFDPSILHKDNEKQLLEVLSIACKCVDQEPRQRPTIFEVVSWLEAIEPGKAN